MACKSPEVKGEKPFYGREGEVGKATVNTESRCSGFFFSFFFLRKISPELTTGNPPHFAEEGWP